MADGRNRRSGFLPAVFLGLASLTLVGCGPSAADSGATVSTSQSAATSPAASGSPSASTPTGPTPSVSASTTPTGRPIASASPKDPGKPNIVFILMDDASMNLVQYMPRVRQMQQNGTTFSKYFVTDSLCCPSRASILTGRYPHNTGVFTNQAPDGGYLIFQRRNQEADTFATDLQEVGYRTALMGKYMNEYSPGTPKTPGAVPTGWNEWAVGGMNAYQGFDYKLNVNGKVRYFGNKPKHYVTDVIAERGAKFIHRAVAAKKPFLLELAPYTPHSPSTPAPRHKKMFRGLKAPKTPAFNNITTNAPAWLIAKKPLSQKDVQAMDSVFRKRVQSLQAIDDMVGRIQAELVAQGVADNTYLIMSSDNGFHLGEHRLRAGKQTAFDTDINVPLVVTGPGVPANRIVDDLAANIDLRPTFAALAGAAAPPAADGRDLSPLLRGDPVMDPRDAVLIEHRYPTPDADDPDLQPVASGAPPDYAALRGTNWLYVEYGTGEREYYDMAVDPDQVNNIVSTVPADRLTLLHSTLVEAQRCANVTSCWDAQRM